MFYNGTQCPKKTWQRYPLHDQEAQEKYNQT